MKKFSEDAICFVKEALSTFFWPCLTGSYRERQELHSKVIVELSSHFIINHLELCPGVLHNAGQFVFKALFCALRIAQSDNKSFTAQGALKDGNRLLYTKIWLHNEGKP